MSANGKAVQKLNIANNASQSGSSIQSGATTNGSMAGVHTGHLQSDELRLQAQIKNFRTLESSENDHSQVGGIHGRKKRGSYSPLYYLISLEQGLISRLFKMNQVMLSNSAVSIALYHLVMVFEYVQLVFFIFYKVPIVNEFSYFENGVILPVQSNMTQSSNTDNSTTVFNIEDDYGVSDTITTQDSAQTFRIDLFVAFINFQIYALKSYTQSTFLIFYASLIGIFIVFLILLFVLSKRLFKVSKSADNIKEWTKYLLKGLSIMMSFYLFLLQIPFITILLQGYHCEENQNEEFVLKNINCDGSLHKILVVFSTLSLLLYGAFLITQTFLFTTSDFDSPLPWASFEKKLSIVRCVYKFILTAVWVYDKKGVFRAQMGIACAAFAAFIVQQRFTGCVLFHKSVHYMTIFYEVLAMWLFLTISLHILADSHISISDLGGVILCSLIFTANLIWWQERKRVKLVMTADPGVTFTTIDEYQTYFFRIHELIENSKKEDVLVLQGIILAHLELCDNHTCQCMIISSALDKLKIYQTIKSRQAQEVKLTQNQHQMMQQELHNQNTKINAKNQKQEHEAHRKITEGVLDDTMPVENSANENKSPIIISGLPRQQSTKRLNKQDTSTSGYIKRKTFVEFDFTIGNDPEGSMFSSRRGSTRLDMLENIKHERELLQFFDDNDSVASRCQDEFEYTKRQLYKFVALLVRDAIQRYPKNINLKIISSSIYRAKLNNEFKAVFDLMDCENCDPSLYDQFIIFRRKLDIEQILIKQHAKNKLKIGYLDVESVFNYEKIYLKYQLHEYLTVNSTLQFWRELLQKQIDASILQVRGSEISKNFILLQDAAKKAQEIYPEDIKFLTRYGIFQLNISNNEFDAIVLFEKAQFILENKVYKKRNTTPSNEITSFGENTACAVVIISSTSTKIGRIMNCNEELENLLGYKRKEIIGKNISLMVPLPIGIVHDKLVERYFETARPTVIEIKRQSFAVDSIGYLQEVHLLVKVQPVLTNKIVFVGFIQRNNCFADMGPVKQDFEGCDQQYIICDDQGNITNVTRGLNPDLGLHAKFFKYRDSIFEQKINIKQVCPCLTDEDVQFGLENDGSIVTFDTRDILNFVEVEGLTSDEIIEVRSNLGCYQAYIQFAHVVIDPRFCSFKIYRVVVIGRLNEITNTVIQAKRGTIQNIDNMMPGGQESQGMHSFGSESAGGHSIGNNDEFVQRSSMDLPPDTFGAGAGFEMGSVASSNTSTVSFTKIVKDFKKTLNAKRTPKNIVILNRLIFVFIILTIILQGIDYDMLTTQINEMTDLNIHHLNMIRRQIGVTELAINSRSYINVANGLEFTDYDISGLSRIESRFDHLGRLIQKQSSALQDIQENLSQTRSSLGQKQNKYEYDKIHLNRLDEHYKVSTYDQPYRVALTTFLNSVLMLNMSSIQSMQFNESNLLLNAPDSVYFSKNNQNTTEVQRTAYFVITNGLRTLRSMTDNATDHFHLQAQVKDSNDYILIIMIVSIFVTLSSIVFLLVNIWQIERIQAEILSLYAHLRVHEIDISYQRCLDFMVNLNQGSLISYIIELGKPQPVIQTTQQELQQIGPDGPGSDFFRKFSSVYQQNDKKNINKVRRQSTRGKMYGSKIDEDIESEEEKEVRFLQSYMKQKQMSKFMGQGGKSPQNNAHQSSSDAQKDFYHYMITTSFMMAREFNENEEATRAVNVACQQQMNRQKEYADMNPIFKRSSNQRDSVRMEDIESKHNKKKSSKIHKSDSFKKKNKGKKDEEQSNSFFEDEIHETGSKDSNISNNHQQQQNQAYNLDQHHQIGMSQIANDQNEMTAEDIKYRKQFFFKTIKTQNWSSNISVLATAILFCGYFIQLYLYHDYFKNEINILNIHLPVFYDRFKYVLLSYAFLKERILLNKNLTSFGTKYNKYGTNYDFMNNDYSTEVELKLMKLQIEKPPILSTLTDFFYVQDSTKFCTQFFGEASLPAEEVTSSSSNSQPINVQLQQTSSISGKYQNLINSVIKACYAAEAGDLNAISSLKNQRGVELLNQGDYDKQTPLHLAVRNSNLEIVNYILNIPGINVNPVDRWGATPLNYANSNKDLETQLKSKGALKGTADQTVSIRKPAFELSDDDIRLYYAAYYGDLKTVTALQESGQRLNMIDRNGRSPLHVASAQGQLSVVEYLIKNGVDVLIKDFRGNDPLLESIRENHIAVKEYLNKIISDTAISKNCIYFAEGLFGQGLHSAIGNFHKKFSDLQIKIQQSTSQKELLLLLNVTNQTSANTPMQQSLINYFSASELYLHRVHDKLSSIVLKAVSDFSSQYSIVTQITFLIFLFIQLCVLIILRSRMVNQMREEILESRGILNLIPNSFFDQNRLIVEAIIKKIKD